MRGMKGAPPHTHAIINKLLYDNVCTQHSFADDVFFMIHNQIFQHLCQIYFNSSVFSARN